MKQMQIYTCGYIGSDKPQLPEKIKPLLPAGFTPKEAIITDDDIVAIQKMAEKYSILLPTQLNGYKPRKP